MQRCAPDSFLSISNDPCYHKCARKYTVCAKKKCTYPDPVRTGSALDTDLILNMVWQSDRLGFCEVQTS